MRRNMLEGMACREEALQGAIKTVVILSLLGFKLEITLFNC
jgi:hypothetical protein